MALHIGDVQRITATFKNAAGTPTNPTAVVLVIRKPDGTESSPVPVSDGSGVYHHDIAIDQAGTWHGEWRGTGAVTATEPWWLSVARRLVTTP